MNTIPRICALLSDFGRQDHYAAVMKAVILKDNPTARLIDISHDVHPFSVIHGAFLLQQSWPYFPSPTVFLVVVDPGVGGTRKRIVYHDGRHYFIGPDNGLVTLIKESAREKPVMCREIKDSPPLFPCNRSQTFEGRDIFARAASMLMNGISLHEFTAKKEMEPVTKEFAYPEKAGDNTLEIKILNKDHFGNIVTNMRGADIPNGVKKIRIQRSDTWLTVPVVSCFSDVPRGSLCAYQGSAQYLEIAINCGNLSHFLGDVTWGDTLVIQFKK